MQEDSERMDGPKIDLDVLRWTDPSDVDPYDFLLLQWDEKLLETIVPELLLPVARMMDAYVHSCFKKGYATFDDKLRRRCALAVLYTEQRPVEELYRLAIECARERVYALDAAAYLAAPFDTPESIRKWANAEYYTRTLHNPLRDACLRYAAGAYHACILHVLDAINEKRHVEGQQAVLRAWLTPSPAHHSDPE